MKIIRLAQISELGLGQPDVDFSQEELYDFARWIFPNLTYDQREDIVNTILKEQPESKEVAIQLMSEWGKRKYNVEPQTLPENV